MRKPSKFPGVLAIVMVIITTLFISIGALSYAAYGSHTRTVVILNLPQDDKFVNAVQFLYSLAILLSTPLQLFPAIRIMENELFTRSGKYNPYIKWQKNAFRFCLVVICALIAWGGAGDLDKFVALVGSFACVPLVYVYPPLLHLKAVAQTPWQRIADYGLCCFGVVGCVYTTVLSIYLWAGGPAAKQPGYCDT
jgi:solute carrier family 36 (proton-coupled amino acid transporter)